MNKTSLKFFALLLFGLVASNCSVKETPIAPPSIEGYVIAYKTNKTPKFDAEFLNKTVYTEYNKNGTYKATLDGQVVNLGTYTYKRTSYNVGSIVESYSDSTNQHGQDTYQTTLAFTDSSSGTWKSTFNIDSRNVEQGTFNIEKRGE